jgi:4'-phosphopantetheinyl transferase
MSIPVAEIVEQISSCCSRSENGVDSWMLDLNLFQEHLDRLKSFLSHEELLYSEKIRKREMRELFYLRKGLVRVILAGRLDVHPCEVGIEYTPAGKPFINANPGSPIFFNISHSKKILMLSITGKGRIGVDVEKINPARKCDVLVRSIFSREELAFYTTLPETARRDSFFKAWVQKEAISKAYGLGLSIGFKNLTVRIDTCCFEEKYNIRLSGRLERIEMNVGKRGEYFFAVALLKERLHHSNQ